MEEEERVGEAVMDKEVVRDTDKLPEEQYEGETVEVELSVGLELGDTLKLPQVEGEPEFEGVLDPLKDPVWVGVGVNEGVRVDVMVTVEDVVEERERVAVVHWEVVIVGEVVEDSELHEDAVELGVAEGQKLPVWVHDPVGQGEEVGEVDCEILSDPDTVTVPLGLVDRDGVEEVLKEVVTVKEVVEDTDPHVDAVELGVAVGQKLPVFVQDPVGQGDALTVLEWELLSDPVTVKLPLGVGVIEFVVVVECVIDTVRDPEEQ